MPRPDSGPQVRIPTRQQGAELDREGHRVDAHLMPARTAVFLTLNRLTSYKVEAAGIEPASRNRFTPASTCVVELFNLAAARPCRPGRTSASPELI